MFQQVSEGYFDVIEKHDIVYLIVTICDFCNIDHSNLSVSTGLVRAAFHA